MPDAYFTTCLSNEFETLTQASLTTYIILDIFMSLMPRDNGKLFIVVVMTAPSSLQRHQWFSGGGSTILTRLIM